MTRWHSHILLVFAAMGLFSTSTSVAFTSVANNQPLRVDAIERAEQRHLYSLPWNSQLDVETTLHSSTGKDNLTTSEITSLESIRNSLVRQEETIIFGLIERAQYRHNPVVYVNGGLGNLGIPPGGRVPEPGQDEEELSFLEYMLLGTESLHHAIRRYASPEEHAFFPDRLPAEKVLEDLQYPKDLLSSVGGAAGVNFNPVLLKKYIEVIVPAVTIPGDDEQHGSTSLADIALLQALSRRIHYGKFVAESKYLTDPEGYRKLVEAGDAQGVMDLLTNDAVEAEVLRRARLKAATYGTEPLLAEMPPLSKKHEETSIVAAAAAAAVVAAMEALGDSAKAQKKVDPRTIESIYRQIVIPLTKDVEVVYLFKRCGKEPPPEYSPTRMSTEVQELSR